MKKISLFKLYLIFLKIGAILLGGGYVILPIIKNELCEKHKIMDEDSVINYFALSQALPGIVAANISMFAGYKIRGIFGAITSMLGIITVPFIIISALAAIIGVFVSNSYVQAAFWGIGISVIALIALTSREIWQKSDKNIIFYLVFILSTIFLVCFNFSPIKTIVIFTIFGIILKKIIAKKGGVE